MNLKNTVLVISSDIGLVHRARHAKCPEEISPWAFRPMFCRILPNSLSSYCKSVVVHTDIERGTIYAGKINCYCVLPIAFVNVGRRIPIRSFNFVTLLDVSHSIGAARMGPPLARSALCSIFE